MNLLKRLTEKKKKLDGFRPLPQELVKSFEDWFRVEFTYSSNAIEGNTLTRIETAEVLERGTAAIQGNPILPGLTQATPKTTVVQKILLRIGELAKETGETLHAIRHWVEKGLVEVAERTESGYQLFDRSMIERVKEIRRLQRKQRLTIAAIKQKLS